MSTLNVLSVENVATMKTTTPLDNQMIRTGGYYSFGDGGGNAYIFHTTGRPSTEDGGFIIFKTGGTGQEYFEAVDKSVANIRQFGCKGDNSPVDAPFCKKALGAAENVYVPKGEYNLSGWTPHGVSATSTRIECDEDAILTGVSNQAFLKMSSSGNLTIHGGQFKTFQCLVKMDGNEQGNLYLEGCKFDGSGTGLRGVDYNSIQTIGSVVIKNCEFHDLTASGIHLVATQDHGRILIKNNYIHDISSVGEAYGIRIGGDENASTAESCVISGNTVKNVSSTTTGNAAVEGIQVLGGCKPAITGNSIVDITAGVGATDVEGIYCKSLGCRITDNYLENAGGTEAAILLKGLTRNATPSGNPFSYQNVISNNVIRFTSPVVETVGIKSTQVGEIVCTGNSIEGVGTAFRFGGADNGTCRGLVCSNNYVYDVRTFIASIYDMSDVTMTGNVITGWAPTDPLAPTTPYQVFAFLFRAEGQECQNVVVADNVVSEVNLTQATASDHALFGFKSVTAANGFENVHVHSNSFAMANGGGAAAWLWDGAPVTGGSGTYTNVVLRDNEARAVASGGFRSGGLQPNRGARNHGYIPPTYSITVDSPNFDDVEEAFHNFTNGSQNITQFSGGYYGQIVTIFVPDGRRIDHGNNIRNIGGVSFIGGAFRGVVRYKKYSDNWMQLNEAQS